MTKTEAIVVADLLLMCCSGVALAQDASSRGPIRQPAKAQSVTINMPEGMTKDQADAVLTELRQIRQLLEKQQAQFARGLPAQPSAAPAAPENVQMGIGSGWYSIGRTDAPVTLVEFSDYQCPFCKRFHTDAYAELKKNYIETGKVRFISRDLPLDFHPFSMKAAEAVRCAGDQGKYWEMRDTLIANSAALSDEMIFKSAEGLAIKMDDFRPCVSSEHHKSEIQKDAADAASVQISGTPSFVLAKSAKDKLDGVKIVGALPYAQFQSAIDQMLKD
jgi:protein-disulfide isomerase